MTLSIIADRPRLAPAPPVSPAAAYQASTVDEGAHRLAHPLPQADCPFWHCAAVTGPVVDRSAETYWRQVTNVPAVAA